MLDAAGLSTAEMERFAHWTNLSETTFVLAPSDDRADYRVRIFTPTAELPFAGHPTLGTCHAWLAAHGAGARDEVVQECAAGLVRIRRGDSGLSFAAPPLVRDGPVDEALVQRLAALLGIDRSEILDARVGRQRGGLGRRSARGRRRRARRAAARNANIDIGIVGAYPPGSPAAFEVRAFFPKDGVLVEDPVTGSLNAAIAPWLLRTGRATAPYVVSQGTLLGRAGRVHVERDDDGTIWVGGATTTCVSGEVAL